MIYTTLTKIRDHSPCESGWIKLLKHLGKTQADDEPLGFDVILSSNNLDDTLWCLRALDDSNQVSRQFALWCARQVEHLNTDPRVKACSDVNERFINDDATQEELVAAAWSARTADGAARAAAWSARTAAWSARTAAWAAAEAAAWAADGAAAEAAAWSARTAAWAADGADDWDAQKTEFSRLINSIQG